MCGSAPLVLVLLVCQAARVGWCQLFCRMQLFVTALPISGLLASQQVVPATVLAKTDHACL